MIPSPGVTLQQSLSVELVVDNEVERCAEIGNIAAESLVGVDRNVQPVEVETIVGGKESGHIGVLIALDFLTWESHPPEILKGLVANGVQHVSRVALDELRVVVV